MSESRNPSTNAFAVHAQQLLGGVVRQAEVGVGSMITIQVEHINLPPLADKIWVRLADWALLEDQTEIVASDLTDAEFDELKGRLAALIGSMVLHIHLFEDGEFHIDFSGQYRLEIWPNIDAYGQKADLVSLFAAGKHVATLTA